MKTKRYLDIRSNGDGVVGRVYVQEENKSKLTDTFKGSTRAHMLKKFKSVFPTVTNICFKRRGATYF